MNDLEPLWAAVRRARYVLLLTVHTMLVACSATGGPARIPVTTLELEKTIEAPRERVWDVLTGARTYAVWSAPFQPGGRFEGTWAEGQRVHFLGPDDGGMVAELVVCRPHERITIRHLGFVVGGVEDTTSDAVRSWAPADETLILEPIAGGTRLIVRHEVAVEQVPMLRAMWRRALDQVEALATEDDGRG